MQRGLFFSTLFACFVELRWPRVPYLLAFLAESRARSGNSRHFDHCIGFSSDPFRQFTIHASGDRIILDSVAFADLLHAVADRGVSWRDQSLEGHRATLHLQCAGFAHNQNLLFAGEVFRSRLFSSFDSSFSRCSCGPLCGVYGNPSSTRSPDGLGQYRPGGSVRRVQVCLVDGFRLSFLHGQHLLFSADFWNLRHFLCRIFLPGGL